MFSTQMIHTLLYVLMFVSQNLVNNDSRVILWKKTGRFYLFSLLLLLLLLLVLFFSLCLIIKNIYFTHLTQVLFDVF